MSLTLKIVSYQSQVLDSDATRVFDRSGGSVGRAQGNDWVLPDPERYISGSHFTIRYSNDAYYLTDTSTNGVFMNQSTVPLGKGNSVMLRDGDQLSFGDYEMTVSVQDTMGEVAPLGGWSQPESDADTPTPSAVPPAAPNASVISETFDPFESEDPGLNFLTDNQEGSVPATGDAGAVPDHTPSLEEAFRPPGAQFEQIPDDWDMTDYSSKPDGPPEQQPAAAGFTKRPQATAVTGPESEPPRETFPSTKPPEPPPQDHAQQLSPEDRTSAPGPAPAPATAQDGVALYAAFLEGAGIDPHSARQEDIDKAMRDYGMLFRTVVQGMMEVLMARASLKSEFRLPLTTIRPVENNPLKFSPTVDDALHNLFVAKGRGYLDPVEAIQEGFADIRNHQVAMIAGMQAAFRELLEIFKPEKFDRDDKGGGRLSLMTINRKSRAWDAFCEFYENAAHDSDSGFQNLFGENFALAYEEQIRRLSMLK